MSSGSDSGGGDKPILKKRKITQNYRIEWEQQFKPWLKRDINYKNKAKCIVCNVSLKCDVSVIKNHSISKKHAQNIKLIPGRSQKSITETLTMSNEQENLNNSKKTAEILFTNFFTEHNIALRTADHLSKIVKRAFPDSKIAQTISFNRTKTTNILNNVLTPHYEHLLAEHLRRNKFSIIIDESTSIAAVKHLCICVRFFNDSLKEIDTRTLKFIEVFSENSPEGANQGATGMFFKK